MQQRYTLTHFLLAGAVALFLVPLMVRVDAEAQLETPCLLRISLMNALLLYDRFCKPECRFHYSTL